MAAHFVSSTSISETKRHRTFNVDSMPLCFEGRRIQKKYCRKDHAIVSAILEATLQNGGHFQSNTSYIGNHVTAG